METIKNAPISLNVEIEDKIYRRNNRDIRMVKEDKEDIIDKEVSRNPVIKSNRIWKRPSRYQ